MKKWFWVTTYSNYFTIYNLSKQRAAYHQFQSFIEDENIDPIYYDKGQEFETLEFPSKFTMGSVRAKALGLFLLFYQLKTAKIEMNKVNGYKTYKLFNDWGANKENILASENMILVAELPNADYNISKSEKDLSSWLYSSEDHSAFFITPAIKQLYQKKQSFSQILEQRKMLILQEEQQFITSRGLNAT